MRRLLIAGFMLLFASMGYAAIGIIPHTGFQEMDGDFINGITQGHNFTFQNGRLLFSLQIWFRSLRLTPQARALARHCRLPLPA